MHILVFRMKEEHILLSVDGPDCNVIKLKPPMVFSKENVDEVVSTLDRILKEVRHQKEDSCQINRTGKTSSVNGEAGASKDQSSHRKPGLDEDVKSI